MKTRALTKALIGLVVVMLTANIALAQTNKPYRVEVRTTTFGGSCYLLGFGATDILNKNSSYIRGSVLESSGTPENIRTVGLDPEKRKRTFFTCTFDEWLKARQGVAPFDKQPEAYKDVMIMIHEQKLSDVIITLNPDIKTLADLKGKTVATWPKGTSKYEQTYNYIAGAGKDVIDSIKWQYTGYEAYDDMILGKTDAALSFCAERERGKFAGVPELMELMSKRKVYFVKATPEMRKHSEELYGEAYGATLKIPANSIVEGVPNQDILGYAVLLAWGVYPDMPEDVVYDVIKTLDENHDKFKEYHPAGIGWFPENYGTYPAKQEYWHPGAKRYFTEKSIGFGDAYFRKVYAP